MQLIEGERKGVLTRPRKVKKSKKERKASKKRQRAREKRRE